MLPGEARNRAIGAVLGALVGAVAHWALVQSGYHMAGTAGIGLALGVSTAARTPSLGWAFATAALAIVWALLVDWWLRPFLADPSLGYFLGHLGDLSRLSQASLLVAAGLGFWFGRGRRRPVAQGDA